jgi:peroxiredoxin
MAIKAGDRIPAATFKQMGPEGPADISTADLFAGKTVVIFGLPGAFTPVCSAAHLPGFAKKADAIRDMGVDAIACVSVNDPFVMQAWGDAHGASDSVMMLADCDGSFTRAVGLAIDLSDFGLGERSERYSMIVKDGLVEAINVEESILAHEASSAETLLAQL